MENLYPLFEQNRILKKELLWSLRDYTFIHVQAEYGRYGQGFLKGWDIKVRDSELAVGPGLLKAGGYNKNTICPTDISCGSKSTTGGFL